MEIEEKRMFTDNIMDKLMVRPSFQDFVEREMEEVIKEEGGITFLKHDGDLP